MNVAAVEGDENESRLASIKRVLSGMFDFSLLRTVAFVPILAAGVLGFFGLFSRFSRGTKYTQLDRICLPGVCLSVCLFRCWQLHVKLLNESS